MLDLNSLQNGTLLLAWNSELPSSSTGDPLGMTLRIGARLGAELLHCITSITPRARYYSFFPWAFARAQNRLGPDAGFADIMRLVLHDERALVLGAVLHHDGQPCEGGALQGSTRAVDDVANGLEKRVDLSGWTHLKDNVSGFDAYKGSLINLGVFKDTDQQGSLEEQEGDDAAIAMISGRLSELGLQLADAFGKCVEGKAYALQEKSDPNVRIAALSEFGEAAGLCELRLADASDLQPLRDMFFAGSTVDTENSHYRRRQTLLFLLWAINETSNRSEDIDQWSFGDIAFYNVLFVEEEPIVLVLPTVLKDIAGRWRIFEFHNYLTASLEGLLAGLVRAIRNHPLGRTSPEVIEEFDVDPSDTDFGELISGEMSKPFLDLTPAQSLTLVGVQVPENLSGAAVASEAFTERPFVERELRDLLIDEELFTSPCGPAVCALLLYSLMLRFDLSVEEQFIGWNVGKVRNPLGDVGMPSVSRYLTNDLGSDWWHRSNREVLNRVLERFVVRQHETMSYEKGVGGSPPFFRVDGMTIVGTDTSCDEIGASNPRLTSAIQMLWDLHLIENDDDGAYQLTSDGRSLLTEHLEGVSA